MEKRKKLKKDNDSFINEFNRNIKRLSTDPDPSEVKPSKMEPSTSCEPLNQDSKFEYI